jgi:hypothetical protein
MFDSNQKRTAQLAQLVEYIQCANDGEELTWLRIEADTSIKMDSAGRRLISRACQKARRPYENIRGIGVRMSSAESTMPIVQSRFVRIDNAVRRADRDRRQLADRHFEQLNSSDKSKMLMLAGFFGAVRAFAKDASGKLGHGKPGAPSGNQSGNQLQLPEAAK